MAAFDNHTVKGEIAKAFMELMTKKTYLDITVTDIVSTAGVARASFYRNFGSIGDVIDLIVDEMSEELIDDILPVLSCTDERRWREFLFEYFYRFTRRKHEMSEIGFRNMSVLFSRMDQKMKLLEEKNAPANIREKYLPGGKIALINGNHKKMGGLGNEGNTRGNDRLPYVIHYVLMRDDRDFSDFIHANLKG